MKRNWKIIRAVLREECNGQWPANLVAGHAALCVEAGYMEGLIYRTNTGGLEVIKTGEPSLTPAGFDAAEWLANEADLDATLRELDEKGVGHVSDIVLEIMQRKARARLSA